MDNQLYKIITNVPTTHADRVREAMGKAGAGIIGNYHYCSFSYRGIGRFLPVEGATPHIGKEGLLEEVEEEAIEFHCEEKVLKQVLDALIDAHPYEEPAIELIKLLDWKRLRDSL